MFYKMACPNTHKYKWNSPYLFGIQTFINLFYCVLAIITNIRLPNSDEYVPLFCWEPQNYRVESQDNELVKNHL